MLISRTLVAVFAFASAVRAQAPTDVFLARLTTENGRLTVGTPVNITMGYTPTHYGPNTVDEATEFLDTQAFAGAVDLPFE